MSLFPTVLGGGLSSSWGWLTIHFLWIATLVGLTGAFLRIALRPTTAELRYLIDLMSLAGLVGAVFVSTALALTSGSAVVYSPAAAPSLRTAFLTFLPVVWLVGAAGSLVYLGLGLWGIRRLLRTGDQPAEATLTETLERWRETLRIPQPVRIAIHQRIGLPLVAGLFRPWILLPKSVATWSDRQVDHVLLHELGHVRRHDNLVTLCQRVFESVFWFHPAVWMVSRWLDEDREHCCDEFVLALTHDPRDYAETLIALAASAPPAVLAGASLPLSQKPLQLRVRRILFREESTMFRPRARDIAATISCGLVWSIVVFGEEPGGAGRPVFSPVASSPSRTTSTEPVFAAVDSLEGSMLRRVLIDLVGRDPTDAEYSDYLTGAKTLGQLAQAATALNNRTPVTSEIDQRLTELARLVRRNWGPEQVIGPPDTMNAGDQVTAWASLSQDAQEEWLICDFGKEVAASSVRVHETYNPGALIRIMFLNDKDEETLAWEGEDPTPRDQPKGVSVIPISPDGKVKRIKLYFDSVAVPGWNEIDAVGLADEDGAITWTAVATASSTFAEPSGTPSNPGLASWAPAQAAGEPNTPGAGDALTAWASATTDGQMEWLICRYEQNQMPAEIVVHETYNPGAVTKITAFDADGTEHLAWEGEDPTPRTEPRGVSVFPVKLTFATKKIKVYIDSPSVPGWNEIDAVGLRDAEGKSVWAKEVEASSTYASFSGGGVPQPAFVTVPVTSFEQMQSDLNDLKASVKELQGLKDEIKELKELLKKAAK